ncbi:F0F1 ATP synthase subunit A [Pedobacter sp.]|nr:F0F1 ATP synthase subunit A [Candidatus Saccharibacteria bacterium]
MILGFFAYGLLITLGILLARAVSRGSTTRVVIAGQWLFEGLLSITEDVLENKKLARRVAPLAITIFLAVVFNNWFGILPGVGPILYDGQPLFRGLAADLNFTFALAAITMVAVQIYAIKAHGFFGNGRRYLVNPFKNPIGAFEGILELVGEFSRFVALSMRLFGNVFGGEVLLTVIAFLSGWFGFLPLPLFMGFELFIGALQAYVFYMLTIIFISLAVEHHGGEHAKKKSPKEPALTGDSTTTVKSTN